MYNYQQLEVLETVVRLKSFQAAAKALHITQPAVSQRIKTLEEDLGVQLLIRDQPMRATPLGEKLIKHVLKVKSYEQELELEKAIKSPAKYSKITIGVNGDSLATWFFDAVEPGLKTEDLLIDLIIENEDLTFSRLKNSEVLGCISSRGKQLPGCVVEPLGKMTYVMACTPEFRDRFFTQGVDAKSVLEAPAVIYDDFDHMHALFLEKRLKLKNIKFPYHKIGNSDGFLKSILHGFAYGMTLKIQAEQQFSSGQLVDVCPGKTWEYTVYWHHQRSLDKNYKRFSDVFVRKASKALKQ